MPDVQFVTPKSPFDPSAELEIKRRRKMAEALMKSGEQPQSTEMVSGVAVKQSPMAALARALTQGVAGYQSGQADQADATIQTNRQKMMADAIGMVGTNPNGAAAALSQTPETAPAGMQIALEMMKDKKALELAKWKVDHGGEGGDPATVKIVNEMQQAAIDAQNPAKSPMERSIAKYRFDALNQVSKSYSIDRGMVPDMPPLSGQPPSAPVKLPDLGRGVPSPNPPPLGIPGVSGTPMPTGQGVQEVPGFSDLAGSMAAKKKGDEQNAKNKSDLNYASPTAEATAIGKATGEAKGGYVKKELQADDNAIVINNILQKDKSGRDILDKATGSGIGAVYAAGKGLVGKSDESTQANSQLAIYGGQLLNNVPRMEGPQSDADVRSYKEQAGKIADPKIPAGDKRAALQAIQQLKAKYAAMNGQMPNQTPAAATKNWVIKDGKLVPQ